VPTNSACIAPVPASLAEQRPTVNSADVPLVGSFAPASIEALAEMAAILAGISTASFSVSLLNHNTTPHVRFARAVPNTTHTNRKEKQGNTKNTKKGRGGKP